MTSASSFEFTQDVEHVIDKLMHAEFIPREELRMVGYCAAALMRRLLDENRQRSLPPPPSNTCNNS
jgi:hypothetical protein